MSNDNLEKQIFPFFTPEYKNQDRFISYVTKTTNDGFIIYIVASLFSKKVQFLDKYIELGIEEAVIKLDEPNGNVLDRMKESIFSAGDRLTKEMIGAGEAVEDVDFSVSMVGFKDGYLYVWLDGGLNVRIYRGKDSLLINKAKEPQFFGSTNVLLGDILAISYEEFLDEYDNAYEDYVLEKKVPEYPVLYLDYQIESWDIQVPESKKSKEKEEFTDVLQTRAVDNVSKKNFVKNLVPKLNNLNVIKDKFSSINKSGILKKIISYISPSIMFIWNNILLGVSSFIIDFVYKIVLRKNSHQFQRFQNGYKKKNLQYLLIFILFIGLIYTSAKIVTRPSSNTTSTANVSDNSKQTQFQTQIQAAFDKVDADFKAQNVDSFNTSFTNLQQSIQTAQAGGFTNMSFANDLLQKATTDDYTLFKITPITKPQLVLMVDPSVAKANISDFSLSGDNVYAIDSANSQVLISTGGQPFIVFASNKDLTKMEKISCTDTKCYVLDSVKGIATLDLASKAFNINPRLAVNASNLTKLLFYQNSINKLYAIDNTDGKLFSYNPTTAKDTLNPPTQWNADQGFGTDVVDVTIDGNVFTVSNTGAITKYYRGKVDGSFKGLQDSNPKITGKDLLATTVAANPTPNDRNRFYVADSTDKLIFVYDKDPVSNASYTYTFKGSYKYTGTDKISFSNFLAMSLSADGNSLYLLENNVVYSLLVTQI